MFEPLPSLIRLHREMQGLTIDALAVMAGVSRTRVIALEKGNDNVSLDILVKIANALEITELRIGRLRLIGAAPDAQAVIAAADAVHAAQRVVDQAAKLTEQAAALRSEIEGVAGPLDEFLSTILTPRATGRDASSGEDSHAKPAARRGARKAG
jgi:transcriptional regulator with XRE-family HTH domain